MANPARSPGQTTSQKRKKEQEKKYWEQMAADKWPWTVWTRAFLGVPATPITDLSLSPAPNHDPSTRCIELDSTDVDLVLDGWGFCLAGFFVGHFPGKEVVLTLMKRWPSRANVSCHSKGGCSSNSPPFKDFELHLNRDPSQSLESLSTWSRLKTTSPSLRTWPLNYLFGSEFPTSRLSSGQMQSLKKLPQQLAHPV